MPSNPFDQFDEPDMAQAPQRVASANPFDQFDDEPPIQQAPAQFSLRAERSSFPTVFDAEDTALRQPISPDQLEAAIPVAPQQGLADFLAPAMNGAERLLSPLGFSWDNARQAQHEMEGLDWREQAATNMAGIDTGMAKIGDALINAPAGLIQQAAGVAPADRWRSDMQSAVENWAPVAARKEAAPHAFNVSEGVGSTAAPVPLLGPAPLFKGWQAAIQAGKPLANIFNVMGGGAITAGALGGGGAVKQNRQIEPMDILAPALAGGVTAGLLTGGIVGAAKGSKALVKLAATAARDAQQQVTQASKAAAKTAMEQYNKLRPLERKQLIQQTAQENIQRDQAAAAQKLMNSLGIQDAESRAAVGAMGGQVTDGLPLAPPPGPVTRNPNPRLPKTLRDAKPKYSNWSPQFNSDLDLALYTIANRGEKSRADDRYYKWVQEVTGWDDATILSRAKEVKDAVKDAPRTSAEKFAVPQTANKHLEQIEAAVDAAHEAKTAEESKQAIQEWAEKVTHEPVDFSAPASEPLPSARRTLERQFYGRKKNQLAQSASEHPADVRHVVEEIATRKAYADYDKAVYQNALEKTWKKFVKEDVDEFKLSDEVTLKRKEVFPDKPVPKVQRQIESEYEALADGVESSEEKKHIAATLTQEFGKDAHLEDVAIPDTTEGAAAKLTELKGFANASKKMYDMAKAKNVEERIADVKRMIEKAEGAKKGSPERLHDLRMELMRLEGDLEFAQYADKVVSAIDDFHVKTEVPHPAGAEHGNVEVAVEHKFNPQQKTLPPEKVAYWKARKAEILRQDEKYVPTPQVSANFRGLTKYGAVMSGVVAAMSSQAANAAEIGAKVASHPDVLAMWNHMPFNEMMLAAAIVKLKLPQKAAQKLLSEEMTEVAGVPVGSLWKDTMDHVAYADQLLNKVARDEAAKHGWAHEDTSLSQQVWERLGQAIRATWGVKISPEAREAALGALREGHITMDEAIAGAVEDVGTASDEALEAIKLFEGLNQEQRNAVTMYRIVQKDIIERVTDRHDELRSWLRENPKADNRAAAKQALVSMEYMMRQLGKRSEATHPIDAVISKAVSKWMDFNFFWNPDHHGTNLTDMFIAGSGRVGLRKIWRANKLLIANPELRTLFKNSNLTGGYRADQVETGAIAGLQKGKIWTDHDLQSDLVNSDRVFLGHALQYFEKHADDIKASGFNGTDEDFVKALYKDDVLQPEIVMDVWANSAEVLSRTLGVDIYRINTNIVNQAPIARSLGIFMRQPARLSRLAMNYAAEGNFKALYTMLGVTLALGGRAAIPQDLHWLGENLNPDSANKMAALADSVDLYYRATGEKLTPKITWSILFPVLGSMNPVAQMSKGPFDIARGMVEGNGEKLLKGIKETVPFTLPRWFGAPAGTITRLFDSVKGAYFDKEKKAYVERYGQLQMSETGRKPLNHWADQLRFAAGPLVPGRDAWADAYRMSKDEHYYDRNNVVRGAARMTGLGGMLPPPPATADQYYAPDTESYDITRQGFNNGYNIPDVLTGRAKKN